MRTGTPMHLFARLMAMATGNTPEADLYVDVLGYTSDEYKCDAGVQKSMLSIAIDQKAVTEFFLFRDGLDRLARDLNPVAARWQSLGIELEVPQAELDAIGALFTGQTGRAQVCLRGVVFEWLNNCTKPATRKVLSDALTTGAVGYKRIADELPQDLFSATGLACKPKRLLNLLKPVAASYQALGVQLGVSLDKIKEFEAESSGQDVRLYLREVLERWLGNDPQLELLVEALTEIGHKRLADTLETAYDGKELVLVIPKAKAKNPRVANQKTEDDSGCDSGD